MPPLPRIGSWTRVPNGSTMLLSVSGTTADNLVSAHAFVLRSDGAEQTLPDVLLQPGPTQIDFVAPHTYSILVDLNFVTAGLAVVDAAVVSPDGLVVPQDAAPPDAFHTEVQGTESLIAGVTFFVTTQP